MLTHKGTQTINTDRLLLRRFEFDDAYDMFKNWANDSEVTKYLTWEPHNNVEVTKKIINNSININLQRRKTIEKSRIQHGRCKKIARNI